ncbi:hypothetical protein DUZ99_13315 [Xylanibacillus composti]|uniref:Copper amine oxidase-like N-terminal domain-containing protein n=1 Tax=Xylanibacillus composti TaxID=1572762 RepID=A0A8J4H4K2_9BACL|nr:stalk domain-containing protein [Xylanibacillus composti]MDT9725954.1 hypothetical protein [Xylanibacillus composti]GIQ70892.1 hypothetical protein XYCOK13_37160 [Xylanibacillus composti]
MRRWKWLLILGGAVLIGTSPFVPQSYGNTVSDLNKVQVMLGENCDGNQCSEGYLLADTVYVPIRFVMESIGAQIDWDASNKIVHIESTTDQTNPTPEPPASNTNPTNEDVWHDTKIIHLKSEAAVEQLINFNNLLAAAYELYEATGEVNWVQQVSTGKVKELKNEMNRLNQEILAYHEANADKHEHPLEYTQLAKKIVDAASYYEMSAQALQRYVGNNNNSDKKAYLLYRFFALEQMSDISKQLLKIQLELEEIKNKSDY